MPWKMSDVDEHKKGLTADQKKKWVKIANKVLLDCLAKGESDKTCAPKAIRIANSSIGANESYSFVANFQTGYQIDKRKRENRDYLVIPVVMMVEGVHAGSQGAVYHSMDELGKVPESWNGRPIVIDHPMIDGIPVSANDPEILEQCGIGNVFDTFVDGTKLKAKAWIDELKLQEISVDLYNKIVEGEELEVSVGVFTDNEDVEGIWQDEEYAKIAHNHRPDHLAILPESIGACSLADGCGLGVNQTNNDMEITKLLENSKIKDTVLSFSKEGFLLSHIGDYQSKGYREKMDAVYSALRGLDRNGKYHYLEEMYDEYLVYNQSSDDGSTLYRQPYTFESGKIELTGDPIEVHKQVDYININKQSKEVNMTQKKNPCPACLEKVNALITNAESSFAEADRGWLETLSEDQLDKIAPKVIEKEVEKKVEVEVNKLTPEDQAALAFGKKQLKERREKYIAGIQANAKDIWPAERLKDLDDDMLERIHNSVVKEEEAPADYSLYGAGIRRPESADQEEPLLPTGFGMSKEK